ncbi:MAG: hypothetical protein II797_02350, partial [Clostridia bacterium]|nr:hypothetical protein [Clostridia bacterium]
GAPLLVASKRYGDEIGLPEGSLKEADRVLIVTDILSEGKDVRILLKLAEKAGASVAGVGCAVENRMFSGADSLRNEGVRVESVCRAENGGFSPRIG